MQGGLVEGGVQEFGGSIIVVVVDDDDPAVTIFLFAGFFVFAVGRIFIIYGNLQRRTGILAPSLLALLEFFDDERIQHGFFPCYLPIV